MRAMSISVEGRNTASCVRNVVTSLNAPCMTGAGDMMMVMTRDDT